MCVWVGGWGGGNISITSKESGLEVNAERIRYKVRFRDQNAGVK